MARKNRAPLGLSEVESSTRRKPKFKVGDVLHVIWSSTTNPKGGLIQITNIVFIPDDEGTKESKNQFYEFKHLDKTMPSRNKDVRGISVIEELLHAKIASKTARMLYGA